MVVDVEDKVELRQRRVAGDQLLRHQRLVRLEVELGDVHLEAELLWQILRLDNEVPLGQVVDAPAVVIEKADLPRRGNGLSGLRASRLLVEHEEGRQPRVRLAFQRRRLLVHLTARQLRVPSLGGQSPEPIDAVQRALHELAALEDVVDRVAEDSLPVDVPLDLEEELPAGHAVGDLERLCVLVGELRVERKQESLLLEALVLLELKVRDVHVLLP